MEWFSAEGSPMKVADALAQIAEIHEQMAKGEIYRGFRPGPMALSGIYGLLAGALQPWFVDSDDGIGFVRFWVSVAVLSGLTGGSATLFNYVLRDDAFARRRTHRVVEQFLPCLVAGVAVTAGLVWGSVSLVAYLPGLWAILFSLGLFSSRAYLPRATGWVALFYLAAGCGLLTLAPGGGSLSGWGVGSVFGIGQLGAALVLHTNLPRDDDA
jgi:hypothetical protein